MIGILIGALLVLVGLVFTAYQPLRHGRLSGGKFIPPAKPSNTLEPRRPASGFSLKDNWPGLALIAIGAILLLVSGR